MKTTRIILAISLFFLTACGKTDEGNSRLDEILVLLGLQHWPLKDARNVLSGFAAKEGCSCYHVEKRTRAECEAYVQNGVPIGLKITETGAESSLGGIKNTATLRGETEGCTLD